MNNLQKLAQFSSRGRIFKENRSIYRTPFQRDRDRIIHSASFRRLKHKTQVFVNTGGDHYRTRITHSIEVSQIARSISKYLGLNDDLSETLSLAHDLGHTPFGHAGEISLKECMDNYGGFDHNLQTLRIVMLIEKKYLKFDGLNLTLETIDGLIKHNGPLKNIDKVGNIISLKNFKNKFNFKEFPVLEAQISNISDDIAYNNHDIQDGLNAKLFKIDDILEIRFFKDIYKRYKNLGEKNKHVLTYQIIRDSIDLMVKDIISNTQKKIKKTKINSIKDIKNTKFKIVDFSSSFKKIDDEIKNFLRFRMYNNKSVLKKNNEGKIIIKILFKKIIKNPRKYMDKLSLNSDKHRSVSDFISGMTDRYAINLYNKLK
tara:strand:- start:10782 stop:11897 length:1116 start_codon:yes stop_codon:yes gene_type:complete